MNVLSELSKLENVIYQLSLQRDELKELVNNSNLSKQSKKVLDDAYWHLWTIDDLLKEVIE